MPVISICIGSISRNRMLMVLELQAFWGSERRRTGDRLPLGRTHMYHTLTGLYSSPLLIARMPLWDLAAVLNQIMPMKLRILSSYATVQQSKTTS